MMGDGLSLLLASSYIDQSICILRFIWFFEFFCGLETKHTDKVSQTSDFDLFVCVLSFDILFCFDFFGFKIGVD